MITLFRAEKSQQGDWLEGEFKALVVGYQREVLSAAEARARFGEQVALPVIMDGEEVVFGQDDLMAYLSRLERFVSSWRLYQSDACYIDEDGQVC